jgi:dTDP-D-glucose 4,6-dehydratase
MRETDHGALVVDKLSYAGNLASLAPVSAQTEGYFSRWSDAFGC